MQIYSHFKCNFIPIIVPNSYIHYVMRLYITLSFKISSLLIPLFQYADRLISVIICHQNDLYCTLWSQKCTARARIQNFFWSLLFRIPPKQTRKTQVNTEHTKILIWALFTQCLFTGES